VVDAAGAPVAGAAVHVAGVIFGDPVRPVISASPGLVTVTSGADGRFRAEAHPRARVVVAAHGAQVSRPVEIREPPEVGDVVLRDTGRIDGTIRSTGQPEGDGRAAELAARGGGWMLQVAPLDEKTDRAYWTAPVIDGRFTIPAVPAGRYAVSCKGISWLGDFYWATAVIELGAGAREQVDLVVDRSGVMLDVVVRSERAAEMPFAQVLVLPDREVETMISVAELQALIDSAGPGNAAHAVPVTGRTRTSAGEAEYRKDDIHARLPGIAPGPHLICVLPFAGDLKDEVFLERIGDHFDKLDATCTRVTVPATPDVQAIVVTAAGMKSVP
jgi:hypothetical protein